jgi:cyanophycinase
MKIIIICFLFTLFSFPQGNGKLVIIGGGDKPDYILHKIIDFAGGKDAKIIVVPNASSEPVESGEYNVEEFRKLGCNNVNYLFCSRDEANQDSIVKKLDGVTGIFFGGGDQAFLTRDLLGTKLLDAIKKIYENGGVVSGTSAGAAVMSKIMITGNELINKDSSSAFIDIKKGNIETIEGFGFIKSAIIDQHFIKRKRLNRLISLMIENPTLVGIGIDESTAIIVDKNLDFEVTGEGQVIVFDPSNSGEIVTDKNGNLGAGNIIMHILVSGSRFSLTQKHILY